MCLFLFPAAGRHLPAFTSKTFNEHSFRHFAVKFRAAIVQLTEVEAVFRALKSDLAIRPIWPGAQIRSADARCRLLDNNSGNRNKKRPVSQILDSSTAKQNACGGAVR